MARAHRGAVKPLFCCGSELSLVSLADPEPPSISGQVSSSVVESSGNGIDARIAADDGIDSISIEDSEGQSSSKDCKGSASSKRFGVESRRPRLGAGTRKKKGDGPCVKTKKVSWTGKLRGKLPRYSRPLLNTHQSFVIDQRGDVMGEFCCEHECHCNHSDMLSHNPCVLCEHVQRETTQGAIGGSSSTSSAAEEQICCAMRTQCNVDRSQCHAAQRRRPLSYGQVLDYSDDSVYSEFFHLHVSPHLSKQYPRAAHSQVDYIHHLVPDLQEITGCGFYWGVIDRYEAERLLETKPEGTFLLRDSAQDNFLFSVSFRRYGRSLHARIEQWNHTFSFDSHDPGVFSTNGVCALLAHYKDPSYCMFFEPMLTLPLNRSFPFSLQHLARATICSNIDYDGICILPLPRSLKEYLRYYHYKHKVRVRCLDGDKSDEN